MGRTVRPILTRAAISSSTLPTPTLVADCQPNLQSHCGSAVRRSKPRSTACVDDTRLGTFADRIKERDFDKLSTYDTAERTANHIRTKMTPDVADMLMSVVDRAVESLRAVQDGFFIRHQRARLTSPSTLPRISGAITGNLNGQPPRYCREFSEMPLAADEEHTRPWRGARRGTVVRGSSGDRAQVCAPE